VSEDIDLLIRGGTVVDQAGGRVADIAISGERIAAIGDLNHIRAARVVDAKGLHILPGVIDTQVHFREPGQEHKEDLETGSRAAVMGGVTTIFDMPDSQQPTISAEAVQTKVKSARRRMWCDYGFFIGATADNVRALTWLEKTAGVAGVRLATGGAYGALLVDSDEIISEVARHGSRRIAVHAEQEKRMQARAHLRRDGNVASHADWRDVQTSLQALESVVKEARRRGRKLHIQNVSSMDELEYLRTHKDIASVAVTPQHLSLAAPDCYVQMGSRAQMNPPIRDSHHTKALWQAVGDGLIDCLASAHSPHTLEEKAKSYPQTPSGMPGVQTLLPVMLTHVAAGRLSLGRLVDLTSAGPQRLFGLRDKGRMAVGYHADFALVDLQTTWEITDQWIASRVSWTPFHGFKATGKPRMTIVRGQIAVEDGRMSAAATGKPVRFLDTMRGEIVDNE